MSYAELRCFLPLRFDENETHAYLSTLTEFCENGVGEDFDARIVLSLSRNYSVAMVQLDSVRSWQRVADPKVRRRLVGLDFCGDEQAHQPSEEGAAFLGACTRKTKDLAPNLLWLCSFMLGRPMKR